MCVDACAQAQSTDNAIFMSTLGAQVLASEYHCERKMIHDACWDSEAGHSGELLQWRHINRERNQTQVQLQQG